MPLNCQMAADPTCSVIDGITARAEFNKKFVTLKRKTDSIRVYLFMNLLLRLWKEQEEERELKMVMKSDKRR